MACDCMGCMGSMASTSIDSMAATSGDEVVVAPRRRGKSKAPNFTYDGPVAVIRLLTDPQDPRTAAVDYKLAHALRDGLASQQEWEGSVNRHQPPPSPDEGSARTGSHHPAASAEQAAPGPPPNRPGPVPRCRGTSRKQPAPKLIGAA